MRGFDAHLIKLAGCGSTTLAYVQESNVVFQLEGPHALVNSNFCSIAARRRWAVDERPKVQKWT